MNPLKNTNINAQINPQLAQNIQQVKSFMQQVKMAQNPKFAIQQAMQNNPQLAQVMQMCQGKNPKDVFYSMCQENGIDPEQIIGMLKS